MTAVNKWSSKVICTRVRAVKKSGSSHSVLINFLRLLSFQKKNTNPWSIFSSLWKRFRISVTMIEMKTKNGIHRTVSQYRIKKPPFKTAVLPIPIISDFVWKDCWSYVKFVAFRPCCFLAYAEFLFRIYFTFIREWKIIEAVFLLDNRNGGC